MELVSVIIPTYNREKTIISSIESVLSQRYKSIEVIVVDDCSTDKTEELILNSFKKDSRVKYIKLNHNSGACAARNQGIKESKGRYIAFLDSDDVFLKDKIELQVKSLKENNTSLCASSFYKIDKNGTKNFMNTFLGSNEEVYNELLYCNYITTGVLMGKRECFETEQFDEEMPRYQDWDLILRLIQKYSISFVEKPTLLQKFQEKSISNSTNHEKTFYSLKKIYEKNKSGYENNLRACSQIKWLMGIHSLFIKNNRHLDYLFFGVVKEKFSIRRFIIFILALIHANKIIDNLLAKKIN